MRVAIIGADGQLGRELTERLGTDGVSLSHAQADLCDPVGLERVLQEVGTTTVINCAAYNFVDRAEEEPYRAWAVNALGPRNLAQICQSHGWPLLHVSTDYVFGLEGDRQTPLKETDTPGPLGIYGISKLAGEYAVRSSCAQHFVVRTCGLYGVPAVGGKGNFVETMLRLGRERGEVRVVSDQVCTPTSAADLATALLDLLRSNRPGLYHATNTGATSWCGFAEEIFRQAGMLVRVQPITTAEFGAKAPRPRYSVLDGSKLAAVLGRPMRPWQEALGAYLAGRP